MKIAKNYLKQVILEETKKVLLKNNKLFEFKLMGIPNILAKQKTKPKTPTSQKTQQPLEEIGLATKTPETKETKDIKDYNKYSCLRDFLLEVTCKDCKGTCLVKEGNIEKNCPRCSIYSGNEIVTTLGLDPGGVGGSSNKGPQPFESQIKYLLTYIPKRKTNNSGEITEIVNFIEQTVGNEFSGIVANELLPKIQQQLNVLPYYKKLMAEDAEKKRIEAEKLAKQQLYRQKYDKIKDKKYQCSSCKGTGWIEYDEGAARCGKCNGEKYIPLSDFDEPIEKSVDDYEKYYGSIKV